MSSISTPTDKTNDRVSPSQRAVHSRSARLLFDTIFKSLKRFLQETVARHRVLNAIRAAAVLDPDIRAKSKPLGKCILVSVGHSLVGWPSMRALFTGAVSLFGLSHE
jgi:hypothetical protein